jgi:hypothetical protein
MDSSSLSRKQSCQDNDGGIGGGIGRLKHSHWCLRGSGWQHGSGLIGLIKNASCDNCNSTKFCLLVQQFVFSWTRVTSVIGTGLKFWCDTVNIFLQPVCLMVAGMKCDFVTAYIDK